MQDVVRLSNMTLARTFTFVKYAKYKGFTNLKLPLENKTERNFSNHYLSFCFSNLVKVFVFDSFNTKEPGRVEIKN